ncbi:MAG: ribosome recycling factor [Chlamydiota bacterium]|nr:ribosome recycling factor [Chlamydiota bacterium]
MNTNKETEREMQQAIDHLVEELKNIRTGRANPGMVDGITVEVYGAPMKLRDIASVTTPEMRQLLITPFDQSNTSTIGKAIEKANLGFMPIVEANLVRINIPPMDDNLRKEMVKLLHKRREEAKVSIRHVRAKYNKQAKADSNISEDQAKGMEKKVQELTDKYCKIVDERCKEKENDISSI